MSLGKTIILEDSNDSFDNYVRCKNCGHLIRYWPLEMFGEDPKWCHSSEIYNPRLRHSLMRKNPNRCWAKGCKCINPEPKDGTVVFFQGEKLYP